MLVLDGGRPLAAGTPEEIIAALPGAIVARPGPPAAGARSRSWRRDGRWRTWIPPGAAAGPGQPVEPDLQDAVTVAALAREPPARRDAPLAQADRPAGQRGHSRQAGAGHQAAGTGPLAECIAVTRRFGAATAVRDVSLAVGPGEIVGLLGANGAGKTTLIRMLLGLLPATAGTIALFGAPPSRDSRRRLGYVPQGLGLYDDLTVAENLSFSAAVFGGPPAGLPAGLRARAARSRRRAAAGPAAPGRPSRRPWPTVPTC